MVSTRQRGLRASDRVSGPRIGGPKIQNEPSRTHPAYAKKSLRHFPIHDIQAELANLPPGWARAVDDDGDTYFFHEDGRTQWTTPNDSERRAEEAEGAEEAEVRGVRVGLAGTLRAQTLRVVIL